MAAISSRDAAALLAVVHDASDAPGSEAFPSSVLWDVARLIPSDACVGYQELDLSGRFTIVDQVEVIGEQPSAAVEEAFIRLAPQNPLRDRRRACETRVLRLSDFFSRTKRRRSEYYAEVWRPHGIEHCLRMWLPAPHGRVRAVYVERSGRDYTDRERTLFALLRPHFARIVANVAFRRRALVAFGLTDREAEVLQWLAEGKTNAEIARILVISPHTVRKHVENIFDKLGVRTRTAAAAHLLKLADA